MLKTFNIAIPLNAKCRFDIIVLNITEDQTLHGSRNIFGDSGVRKNFLNYVHNLFISMFNIWLN